jgi:hypothetical protein
MKWNSFVAVLAGLIAASAGAAAPAATAAAGSQPVEVMVLGTYHFGNPGQDLNNVRADDVRTPQRQKELAALAAALAEWRPTRVMIERQVRAPDLADPNYRGFTPAMLLEDPDERVQIGYRVAHLLGHEIVYGIDEQPGEGEPDYFPFGPLAEFAAANGQQAVVDGLMAKGAEITKTIEKRQETMPIAEILALQNGADSPDSEISHYYGLFAVGDTDRQPGADLNAMWYLRNAKIFAKLMQAARPGDRVLVVYGSGHNYWLRHFARETPGFVNVDPVPWLARAR